VTIRRSPVGLYPARESFTHPPGEDRTTEDLEERAREIGTEGRADMSKDELIDALSDTSSGWRARSSETGRARREPSASIPRAAAGRPRARTQARGRPAFPLLF